MELTRLSFENYKAFGGRQDVEVRPLTVFIGRNSSGKSAIVRLPLLLAGALSGRSEAPIELVVDGVDFGASFVDLIHNRRPHGAIGLGATFQDGDEELRMWATVQHYDDLMLQVIAKLEVHLGDFDSIEFVSNLADPRETDFYYWVTIRTGTLSINIKAEVEESVNFRGLRPILAASKLDSVMTGLSANLDFDLPAAILRLLYFDHFGEFVSRIGYLGPFREAPQRLYRYPGGSPQSVGRSGVNAPALLGADALRHQGSVLKAVSDWYCEHLGGWPLDVVRQGDGNTFSIVLRSPDDDAVTINLADVGTGLSQVLPLVVQRQFESVTGKRVGLEIVEQPELHLHPAAHGSLADLYIEAAKQPGARFLIETHSENFILRIRRRVADGSLDPEMVRIYWIDDSQRPGSRIETIDLLPTGDVTDWPRGVFSEDFEELKAIRSAQRKLEPEE